MCVGLYVKCLIFYDFKRNFNVSINFGTNSQRNISQNSLEWKGDLPQSGTNKQGKEQTQWN